MYSATCDELTFTNDMFVTGVVMADHFFAALSVLPADRDASLLPSRDEPNSLTLTRWSPIDCAALFAG